MDKHAAQLMHRRKLRGDWDVLILLVKIELWQLELKLRNSVNFENYYRQ